MKNNTVELKALKPISLEITIVGDGDLVLNKMNDVTVKQLTDKRKNKAKDIEIPNM